MYKYIEKIFTFLYPVFRKWGLGSSSASYISLVLNITIMCVLAYIMYAIFRLILVTIMAVIAQKTKTKFECQIAKKKLQKTSIIMFHVKHSTVDLHIHS